MAGVVVEALRPGVWMTRQTQDTIMRAAAAALTCTAPRKRAITPRQKCPDSGPSSPSAERWF